MVRRELDHNRLFLDAPLEVDFAAINIKAMRAHGRLSSMASFAKSVANRLLLGSGGQHMAGCR
jgi:hypothetical protein